MNALFSKFIAMFYDHLHWTQEEMDESLNNFARITLG